MRLRKFISELNRRNVFKAIIAYLAVAWVILQIASIILPIFETPDYSLKIVIYVLSVGLILWIGFAWVYDLTSKGFKKTDDIINKEEVAKLNNRRLNKIIVGALFLAVLLLISISFWAGSRWNEGAFKDSTKKVAVLPFLEDSENHDAYFKAGMTDALITELSKVDELRVISQTSTRLMTGSLNLANMLVLDEIERVDYFVSGSVDRISNNLNINIQLKESLQSKSIWGKEYSSDISKATELLASIASDLARQMGVIIKNEDAKLWSNLRLVKPEIYELYLKGKHELNKSTPQDWLKGMVYLKEAIDKDPSDSYAYSGLAEGYIMLGHGPTSPPDVFQKAREAALRSIQLDSTNASGWAALAHFHTYFGWDWELAEYAFNRANDLNPNLAYNHYHRAWYLALFGRMNEAIEEHKLAQELDPFTPLHTAWLGELYRYVGQYEVGLEEVEKVEYMQDDYALGLLIKGNLLVSQGHEEQGIEILQQAIKINPSWKYFGYGQTLIQSGKIEEGKAIIREVEAMPINSFSALGLALMYVELGDFDNAIKWFNHDRKHAFYPWIRILVLDEQLRQDPRFLELIKELNLPDPSPLVYDPI